MIATVISATLLGIDGHRVTVEVHVSNGLPNVTIVGLPDAACRESRDRVRAALLSSGFEMPRRRVTINLAPSSLRKTGSGLDLAMAIGLLIANGKLSSADIEGFGFVGELGLDGTVRAIEGTVPLVDALKTPNVVVAPNCAGQAGLVSTVKVCAAQNLCDLVAALKCGGPWVSTLPGGNASRHVESPDMRDVKGQPLARWALEVAAAGGHNILLNGPPGSGKTMLAKRINGLLPDLDETMALAATRIYSAAGLLSDADGLVARPPLRAPHHTSSMVSIVGGGNGAMRPGEVSLAHGGVLFLDEMAEFPSSVLNTLRQPLEDGIVRVCRARLSVTFPARFLLVGATNPCPCGNGLRPDMCQCPDLVRARYAARLSGPLLDRIDLRVNVERPMVDAFFASNVEECSAVIRERVLVARERARHRGFVCNADMAVNDLDRCGLLSDKAQALLKSRMRAGALTARGLTRLRRVALTIADLQGGAKEIDVPHVLAALQMRPRVEQSAVA